MFPSLVSGLLMSLATISAAEIQQGTQLTYQGTVQLLDDNGAADSSKSFTLSLWIGKYDDTGSTIYWVVDEQGRGRWPWVERFGKMALNSNGEIQKKDSSPALLYDYGDGKSVVSLLSPLLRSAKEIAAGKKWQAGQEHFEVGKATKVDNREVWEIHIGNVLGRNRVVWKEKDSDLVVKYNARVFMNMGTEYELKAQLTDIKQLSEVQTTEFINGFDAYLKIKESLNRESRSPDLDWTKAQIETLRAALPEANKLAAKSPLQKIAIIASRDLNLQSLREDEIVKLAEQFQGQALPEFEIKSLDRKIITHKELQEKVTVFHFWEYQNENLEEPYGQVGYLDFLYNKRNKEGMNLYGVAVNGDLSDPSKEGKIKRSASKLKSFMKLDYPILLDDGSLLKKFGDPRTIGAKLPLYVVIGKDGKISHYHVGLYKVHPNRGLIELDLNVLRAIKK